MPLNYLEWGTPSAPAVLLLHGLRGYAYAWRQTAERLAERYHCLALCANGHGDSSPTPDGDYSYELYAGGVHALVEQLGLSRVTIIGHSMGGRTAITYAATYPERTQAIVTVDIAPRMPDEAAWALKRALEGTPADFASWEEAVGYSKKSRPNMPAEVMEERAFYAFRLLPSGKVAWKHDPKIREEWLGPELPARGKVDLWGHLVRIRCPLLVVKAETTNQLDVELCERMARYGEGSRWVEIPGTTHMVYDDNLDGFLKEVEPFLAQVTTAAVG
jgi:pimeloyl-ACP methyl ester carboxylesterase